MIILILIEKIREEKIKNEENIYINNYAYKYQNLLLLLSDDYCGIIYKFINILVPFLDEIINNNFYLFLPINIINGINFIVKYFFKYNSLNYIDKFLSNNNIISLINVYIKLNLKLLGDNINKNNIVAGVKNISLLFDLLENFERNENKNSIIEENAQIIKEQKLIHFFKEEYFQILFHLFRDNYIKGDNLLIRKNIQNFIIYYSSKYNTDYYEYFSVNFLKLISEEEHDFFLILLL